MEPKDGYGSCGVEGWRASWRGQPGAQLSRLGGGENIRAKKPKPPSYRAKAQMLREPGDSKPPPSPDLKAPWPLLQEALLALGSLILLSDQSHSSLSSQGALGGVQRADWPCFGQAMGFGHSCGRAGPGTVCCDKG